MIRLKIANLILIVLAFLFFLKWIFDKLIFYTLVIIRTNWIHWILTAVHMHSLVNVACWHVIWNGLASIELTKTVHFWFLFDCFVATENFCSARIKHLSVHDEHQFTDQRIWSLAECGKQIGFRITTKWKIWDIKHFKVSNDYPNRIIIYESEPSKSLKCQKTTLSAKMSYWVT